MPSRHGGFRHTFHHSSHHSRKSHFHSSAFGSSNNNNKPSFGSSSHVTAWSSSSSGNGCDDDCCWVDDLHRTNEWKTGLFDIFYSPKDLCESIPTCGRWIQLSKVSDKISNLDDPNKTEAEREQTKDIICAISCVLDFALYCTGTPIFGTMILSSVRKRYNIQGNTFGDFLKICFCTPCAATQAVREMALRNEHPSSCCSCTTQEDYPDAVSWQTDVTNPENIKKPEPTEMGEEKKKITTSAAATTSAGEKKLLKEKMDVLKQQLEKLIREEKSEMAEKKGEEKQQEEGKEETQFTTKTNEPIFSTIDTSSPVLPVQNVSLLLNPSQLRQKRTTTRMQQQPAPQNQYPHYSSGNNNNNNHNNALKNKQDDPANFVPMSIVFGGTGFLPSERVRAVPSKSSFPSSN